MSKQSLRLSSETVYVLSDSVATIPSEATLAIAGGAGMSAMSGGWMAGGGGPPDLPLSVRRFGKAAALIGVGVAAKAAYDHFRNKK